MSRSLIAGSERSAPPGTHVGECASDERAEVSVYLKDETPHGKASRASLHAERGSRLRVTLNDVAQFAKQFGLKVTLASPGRRLVKLEGSIAQLEMAFGTKLQVFEHEGRRFRARTGALSVPSVLSSKIEAILGLDTRPIARPRIVFPRVPAAATGYPPNMVAALYDFPTPSGEGRGGCVGLIELGGGYRDSDTSAAFAAMGVSPPFVIAVPVSGGSNAPGKDQSSDGEVALDIQVTGGVAPGIKIAVYFAPNTDQGFVDAISSAVHDVDNGPSVVSISWGSAESSWTRQAIASMNSTFSDAASLNVTVCAASGDGLASDGINDGQVHVDFPASSPLVVGCGGTKITVKNQQIASETVWNSDGGGTGGGISGLFAVPDYQDGAKVPVSVSTGKPGRGVPDVAANADPNSGYRIVIQGAVQIIGGTSAAAPLWAGLFALLNGAGGPVGQPHTVLYANPSAFHDIQQGDNRSGNLGYAAGSGWDACTGLGTPNGSALFGVFAARSS